MKDFARNQERNNWLVENVKLANIYRMQEYFIDTVYGLESKIDKEPWLELVSTKVPWILKPETMRKYLYDMMHKEKVEDREYDEPDYPINKRWSNLIVA